MVHTILKCFANHAQKFKWLAKKNVVHKVGQMVFKSQYQKVNVRIKCCE